METIMSKHDDRLEQKSPAISALDDADLEKVTGGEVTFEYGSLSVQYVQQKPDGALDKK
jgi:hypothetical protein